MFRCSLPPIHFGCGSLAQLGALAAGLGRQALLAVDPYLDRNGVADEIVGLLGAAGVGCLKWTDIQPNPSCLVADRAAEAARSAGCDLVVAAGGGSAIDFGKGVAILVGNPGNCWDYTERKDHTVRRPLQPVLPLLAIPTTAGTGSEATPFAVFNNPLIHEKSTIVSDRIYPAAAIVVPDLMRSMPPRLTASTGFDAFAHALESFISLQANAYTRLVAREAMQLIVRWLPTAVADGQNRPARENLAWASTLAGSAIARIGVTLPHSLGQPVSGLCGAPHGESVAACMVQVLEFSYQKDLDRFADLAAAIDPTLSGQPVALRAAQCPALVRRLLDDIGLSVRYGDFGLTRDLIPQATRIALTGYYFDIGCHPCPVSETDITNLYLACL